jgi:hypothetical protein
VWPRHLARIPGGAHFILVPADLKGVGSRLYTIDNVFDRTTPGDTGTDTQVIRGQPNPGRQAPGSPLEAPGASASHRTELGNAPCGGS